MIIPSQDIWIEFCTENFVMIIIKSGKRQRTKEIEQSIKVRIRTLGEKDNWKYLGILDEVIIKQVEMKEKIKKITLDERENFLKQSFAAGISSKE